MHDLHSCFDFVCLLVRNACLAQTVASVHMIVVQTICTYPVGVKKFNMNVLFAYPGSVWGGHKGGGQEKRVVNEGR